VASRVKYCARPPHTPATWRLVRLRYSLRVAAMVLPFAVGAWGSRPTGLGAAGPVAGPPILAMDRRPSAVLPVPGHLPRSLSGRLLAKSFGQLTDLGFWVTAVAAQGLQEGELAVLGPVGHGLGLLKEIRSFQ
jgi:hypothetical protein